MQKRDRTATYSLIALLCVAALVGYSRFGGKGDDDGAGQAASIAILDIPDVSRTIAEFRGGARIEREPFQPLVRDLFVPDASPSDGESEMAVAVGDLQVDAIMLSGGQAMASINGEVFQEGDRVGGRTVARITEDRVVLRAGDEEWVLELSE